MSVMTCTICCNCKLVVFHNRKVINIEFYSTVMKMIYLTLFNTTCIYHLNKMYTFFFGTHQKNFLSVAKGFNSISMNI